MQNVPKSLLNRFWPHLLLTGLTILFFGDVWFGGRMLVMRDFVFFFEPIRQLYGDAMRRCVFPTWFSLLECGMPMAASPYHSAFYPPNLIYLVRPVQLAVRLDWTFHFSVAAIGCYLLGRYWRLGVGAALFAAVTLAFSTVLMTVAEFSISLNCLVWMPLMLLFTSKVIDTTAKSLIELPAHESWRGLRRIFVDNGGSIVGMAVVSAFQVCACGEIFYYCCLMTGAFVTARLLWHGSWRTVALSMGQIVFAAILGIALAAPQLLLTAEYLPFSVRAVEIDPGVHMDSAFPTAWLAALLPYLFGRPGYPDAYWGHTIYEFVYGTLYVGVLPLIALFFCWSGSAAHNASLEVRERRFLARFFSVVVVAGLTMAAGKYTPVYAFLHHWFPGLGRFRFPTKFYLLVAFALAMLGGLGMQALVQEGLSRKCVRHWKVAAAVFVVFLLGYLMCLFDSNVLLRLMAHPGTPSAAQMNSVRTDYALAAVFTLLGLGLFGMLAFRRGSQRWVQGGIILVAFLNLCVITRQAQPTGSGDILTRRPETLMKRIGSDPMHRFFSPYQEAQQYMYGESRPEIWDWAVETGATWHAQLAGLNRVTPGGLSRYVKVFFAMISSPSPHSEKLADMLAMRYVVSGAPFEQVFWANASREIHVSERPHCLPRAFLVARWRTVSGADTVFQTITADSFDPHQEAIVEPLAGALPPIPWAIGSDQSAGEVGSFIDHGNSVTMKVSAAGRALLVLGDTWYPGWTVTVDGVKCPIYQTNYLFRGVFLESGSHRVEFSYRPTYLTAGLWSFALAVVVCIALVGMRGFFGKQRLVSPPSRQLTQPVIKNSPSSFCRVNPIPESGQNINQGQGDRAAVSKLDDRSNNGNLLRLILATLVILSHAPELVDGNRHREILTFFFHTRSFGDFAVACFFVLSGYFILQSWDRKPRLSDFLRHRILRIFPGFLVAWVLCVIVVGPLGAPAVRGYIAQFDTVKALSDIVLLQVPFPGWVFLGTNYPYVNSSMWTIPYEFHCYLLVALFGLTSIARRRWIWGFLAITGIGMLVSNSAWAGNLSLPGWYPLRDGVVDLVCLSSMFVVGGCFYHFRDRIKYNLIGVCIALPLLLLGLSLNAFSSMAIATAGGYLLFWFAFACPVLRNPFGASTDISYGVYLYGWPVQKLVLWYFPLSSPWLLFVVSCGLSFICGMLSWRFVEKPFLQMKNLPWSDLVHSLFL